MKPDVPLRLIDTALGDRFTSFILHPLIEGDDSRAFRIEADSGQFVLRLNGSRRGFDKDRWAEHVLAETVPVPTVIEIFPLAGVWACISGHLAGVPFQRAPEADLSALALAVADALAAIGEQAVPNSHGYGPIDAAGNGTLSSWRDFLHLPLVQKWTECSGDPVFDRAALLLERLSSHAPEARSLVHGDFGGGNVLVAGRSVTGVIDWSEALYGDPLYDVANVHFWRPWLRCLNALAGVLDAATVDPALLQLYGLRIGVENMRSYAQSGDGQSLAWVRQRTAEILDGVR